MNQTSWHDVDLAGLAWMPRLNQLMKSSGPPTFSGATLYLTSDYSGFHKGSLYEVITFLVVDWDTSMAWHHLRRTVRSRFLPTGRRVSFKALNDRFRQRALMPFLAAADSLTGLCASFVLSKRIRLEFMTAAFVQVAEESGWLTGSWTAKTLNRMFTVVHLAAFLIGGLAQPGQNVYWISDEDSIFADEARSTDVSRLLSTFTSMCVSHDLGELGVGTTHLDEGDRLEEDLASIPDLVAGALSEYVTTLNAMCGGRIGAGLAYASPQGLSWKTERIMDWIWDDSHPLSRIVLLFEATAERVFGVSRLQAW